MKIKKFSNYKLNESPDNVRVYSTKLDNVVYVDYRDQSAARPFAWSPKEENINGISFTVRDDNNNLIMDELWLGEWEEGHSDDCPFITGNGGKFSYDNLVHKGRLFYENGKGEPVKIISFWRPDNITDEDYKRIIDELSEATGEDFSDWYVDLMQGVDDDGQTKIIPATKFKSGFKMDPKQIEIAELYAKLHTASYDAKPKIIARLKELGEDVGKIKGFGSDKQWQKVKGAKSLTSDREMTPAQWNYHKKQENLDMKIKKFSEINESQDGEYMTQSNIQNILRSAQYLEEKFKNETEFEDWIKDHISKVDQYLTDIHNFYKNGGETKKD